MKRKHFFLLTLILACLMAAMAYAGPLAKARAGNLEASPTIDLNRPLLADAKVPAAEPSPTAPAVPTASERPSVVAADESGAEPAAPTKAKADEVTVEDLTKQAQKIQQDWESLGWMGGTIGIIGFLLLLLRFKPIDKLLEENDLKRFKPYAAAALGLLLGFSQCFITGKGWGASLVAGLIAGIATPGLHLLFTKGNTK